MVFSKGQNTKNNDKISLTLKFSILNTYFYKVNTLCIFNTTKLVKIDIWQFSFIFIVNFLYKN